MATLANRIGDKFSPTFAYGTCHAPAYAEAAHRLVNTFDKAEFVISVHPVTGGENAEKVVGVYVFQRVEWEDDDGSGFRIRWCGERDDPMGAGSHSLAANNVNSPAEVAAALAISLERLASKHPNSCVTLV